MKLYYYHSSHRLSLSNANEYLMATNHFSVGDLAFLNVTGPLPVRCQTRALNLMGCRSKSRIRTSVALQDALKKWWVAY